MAPELLVFTYKEPGRLLSRMAHDLRLRVHDFEVTRDGPSVRVECNLRSLRVDGAMQSGRLEARALRERDLRSIEQNAMTQVLEVNRHPKAEFEGTYETGSSTMQGHLDLHGRRLPITLSSVGAADALVFRAELVPSRWGIEPYRAFGGTLRLQDRVTVEARIPA